MDIVNTDGQNKDFEMLSNLLDISLNELIGATKREKYHRYNMLDEINDVFIAYENGVAAACASFKRYDEVTAEVKRVFTQPEFRGMGFARCLMMEVESLARKKGFQALVLETCESLKGAVALYEKLGFTVIPNFPPYENSPISLCMKKELQE